MTWVLELMYPWGGTGMPMDWDPNPRKEPAEETMSIDLDPYHIGFSMHLPSIYAHALCHAADKTASSFQGS